jgi:hypothetical protein
MAAHHARLGTAARAALDRTCPPPALSPGTRCTVIRRLEFADCPITPPVTLSWESRRLARRPLLLFRRLCTVSKVFRTWLPPHRVSDRISQVLLKWCQQVQKRVALLRPVL